MNIRTKFFPAGALAIAALLSVTMNAAEPPSKTQTSAAATLTDEKTCRTLLEQISSLTGKNKNREALELSARAYALKGVTAAQKSQVVYLHGLLLYRAGRWKEADEVYAVSLKNDKHSKTMKFEIYSVYISILMSEEKFDEVKAALKAMDDLHVYRKRLVQTKDRVKKKWPHKSFE